MSRARALTTLCFLLLLIDVINAQQRPEKHPGLHPVRAASGKWGFIDQTGRFRIPPRYNDANEFSDGVAHVYLWDGNKRTDGIVNVRGEFKEIPDPNDSDAAFHDGLMRIQTSSGERKHGYIDKTGRVVIEPQYYWAGHFSEGLAWISVLKEGKWLYGFIDKSGKTVIEPQFVFQPRDFQDGLAKVMAQYHSGFIDRTGKFFLKVDFENVDDSFSEGLLATIVSPPQDHHRSEQTGKSKGVYLDRKGKVVLEIPFWENRTAWQRNQYSLRHLQLGPFSEGLAPVLSFYRVGFIDRAGKVVIEPEFRETNGFSEGLAAVKIIGNDGDYVWGFIDRTGKSAITPKFRNAKPFRGGLARVLLSSGKELLIDKTGKVIWEL